MRKIFYVFLFLYSSLCYSKSIHLMTNFDESKIIFNKEAVHLMASDEKVEISKKHLINLWKDHLLSFQNDPYNSFVLSYFIESPGPIYCIDRFNILDEDSI